MILILTRKNNFFQSLIIKRERNSLITSIGDDREADGLEKECFNDNVDVLFSTSSPSPMKSDYRVNVTFFIQEYLLFE